MDLQVRDKAVLITGGAKGIGAAIARGAANEGAIPVLADKDGEAGHQLQSELRQMGAAYGLICVDLLALKPVRTRSIRSCGNSGTSTSWSTMPESMMA